ncbi:hypothetical protein K2173_025837 [Erythroxylum novogranatense]|uniref:Uncharacterized protein n=1 Tax=Erythroxylum novogranatense TaxID=1862640 RepID=A0AAV8SHK0_9ROSI|nr:hypothetical protein K2173_025837 [Erythroxylum novogranatense]
MEQPPYTSQRREEPELSLREWTLRAQISRENTKSRRFSGSNIKSFREDARSFRSSVTISSTASSPGYSLREEIDPSTYSFTSALKALQARSVYNSWECLSPDGFALNSKWNEAEKYICNPQSGEVPMECLSAKTLSGRSFRNLTSRITMSVPLVNYSSHSRSQLHTKPSLSIANQEDILHLAIQEEKSERSSRNVGTQSTPPEHNSRRASPPSTPPIMGKSLKRCETEGGDSPNSDNAKPKAEDKVMIEGKETREEIDTTKEREVSDNGERKWWCSSRRQSGCLPMMRRPQREKHKPLRKKTNSIFLLNHLQGCWQDSNNL